VSGPSEAAMGSQPYAHPHCCAVVACTVVAGTTSDRHRHAVVRQPGSLRGHFRSRLADQRSDRFALIFVRPPGGGGGARERGHRGSL